MYYQQQQPETRSIGVLSMMVTGNGVPTRVPVVKPRHDFARPVIFAPLCAARGPFTLYL